MNLWNEPANIFAPLIAAVPPDTEWAGFGNALIAAAECVPVCQLHYNMKRPGKLRRRQELRHRVVYTMSGDQAMGFSTLAGCVDKPVDEPASGATDTHWRLGLTRLKDGLCQPAVPPDFDSALLECSLLRLGQFGQAGAPQMALLRHLWAEAVFRASPGAIVFGGQHGWQEEWWQEAPTQDVGAPAHVVEEATQVAEPADQGPAAASLGERPDSGDSAEEADIMPPPTAVDTDIGGTRSFDLASVADSPSSVATNLACESCGGEIESGDRFCASCGQDLGAP